MVNKKFKILAIDGHDSDNGNRSESDNKNTFTDLYSARILQQFETALQQKHDDYTIRLVDYFDMVCGTPNGGLTALALSLRKPMAQLCSFYEEHGEKIPPSSTTWYEKAIQGAFRSNYSKAELQLIYGELFEDHELGDSDSLLCIPTFDFTQGTTHKGYGLFKFDHREPNLPSRNSNNNKRNSDKSSSIHNHISYLDVALNLSTAPEYSLEDASAIPKHITQTIDAAAWVKHPSLSGLIEALNYFVGQNKAYDSIQILSIANLDTNWTAQSESSEKFLSTFLSALTRETEIPLDYLRIPSSDYLSEQVNKIALGTASNKTLLQINEIANTLYQNNKDNRFIQDVFSTKKTYQTCRH